jgi:hypothetical protein
MALPVHSGSRPLIQFRNHFTDGRTPWTSDQPSQGLYLNRGQHKENKLIHTPTIHAVSEIRTHDPSVRASEDSSRLRRRGYCDLLVIFPYLGMMITIIIMFHVKLRAEQTHLL